MAENKSTQDTPKTLTEFCGVDDAQFERYLEQKESFLKSLDEKAKARVSSALEKRLAWVA
jgi:hypothetical protein